MVDLVSIGSVFIDDIVYPDGRTDMGMLGGGAVHAAAAMVVWGERPGLAARVGTGVPDEARAYLERHFALEGLSAVDFPQIRAWQVFEADGTRRELMRVDITQPFQDGPPPQTLPPEWQSAKGLYMVLDGHGLLRWRNMHRQPTIMWEPNQPYMVREHAAEFKRLLSRAELVSPNLLEARAVFGFLNPESLVSEMLANGAEVAALRMGENGSLVATKAEPRPVYLPAVPVERIADVTGAGNAYCGAFLAGWIRTGDATEAGRWGAVAASFCLEATGVIDLVRPGLIEERDKRLAWLQGQGA